MKTIDESRLETDLAYRFEYLAEFIGFGSDDAAAILASAPYLGPMIPQLVEQTYARLLAYDSTARHFVPRQAGYDGPLPGDLAAITAGHPQIQFRKEHLSRYFMQILGRNCDARLVPYLDMVGKIHTPRAGNTEIDVPLVQMNALMGYLSDVLTDTVFTLPLDESSKRATLRAFGKLLWIQNDFITRHYQAVAPDTV
jgi:Protoglobin